MHCIGVDVSKQELVTFDGKRERIFPNKHGLAEFGRFLKRSAGALVVFEPTSTYSRRLETLCRTERISCCQLNPRVVPHLRQVGKGRSKTDSTDAELLYRYGIERGHSEAEQLENDALAESIQARLACYRVAQKARVSYQNVLEALSQDPATSNMLLAELRAEIAELKRKEKQHLDAAQQLVEEDEQAAQRLAAFLSIPGVGPITALTLLALFRKYADANRSQIVALAGFDPIQFQSGTSVHGKSRISKRGNREVRKRLFEATLSAARYNPSIRAIYRRLKEGGKPDKVARIAAARKLLLIAHAIYESGESFRDPNQKEA
ncbi:IS110 family transposase [Candidatus Bipolaricaulota bacterium]|nr:IS110 family transposase [Candidatus Bipolaricaulota bacterium]